MNGLLSVDAVSGAEYLKLTERAQTKDISSYFAELCLDCVKQGFTNLSIILDNNSTHKQKMQAQLQDHLSELGIKDSIEVSFTYTPPYSPDFNLAEYVIHLLRLWVLHHQPVGITIDQVRENLQKFLSVNQVQTPEQIRNTLQHIYRLIE